MPPTHAARPDALAVSRDRRIAVGAGGRRAGVTATAINAYGPYVLALYMLASTRWGSYLLPGPPYVGDLAILVLLVDRVVALAAGRRVLAPNDPWTALIAGGLLILAGTSFLFGEHSTEAARDFAPFAYAILVFLTPALSGRRVGRAETLLSVCLYLHLAWVTAALAVPDLIAAGPTPGNASVEIFSLRSDMDGLVNGLAAALGLYRVLSGRGGMLLFGWGLTLVVVMHSRIALLATGVLLLCVARYAGAQRRRWPGRPALRLSLSGARLTADPQVRRLFAVAALAAVLGLTFTVLAPTSFDRLSGTFGTPGNEQVGARAAGTTRARLDTWSALEGWIVRDPWRSALGAGFGINVMTASGASIALVHSIDPDLRAPHNFLLNAWARLGLVGLALVALLFAAGVRLAIKVARIEMTEIDLLAALLTIGIPMAAAVGVIVESPFGAIPYYWALGHLSSRLARSSQSAPAPTRGREPVAPAPAP